MRGGLAALWWFLGLGQAKRVAKRPTVGATSVGATSVCDVIAPDLPRFCTCASKALGGSMTCAVNFLDLDTIGVVVDMEPCADPMNFDVDVWPGVLSGARLVSRLF